MNCKRIFRNVFSLIGVKGLVAISFLIILCVHYTVTRSTVPLWFNEAVTFDDIVKYRQRNPTEDVDMRNNEGLTGLMVAVGRMMNSNAVDHLNFDIIKLFLDAGADINAHGNNDAGDTPLHIAVYNGNLPGAYEMITYLIDHGADVRAVNHRGETPLHYAVANLSFNTMELREKIFTLLIQRGADINALTHTIMRGQLGDFEETESITPLHLLVSKNEQAGVEQLTRGISILTQDGRTLETNGFGTLIDFSIKNNKGQTAMESAEEISPLLGATILTKGLVEVNDLNTKQAGMGGLMLWAIRGNKDKVEQFLRLGAKINAPIDESNLSTVLHLMMLHQKIDMLEFLIGKGADVTLRDSQGNIPLLLVEHVSKADDRIKATNILLAKNKNTINWQNNNGDTLLHLIVQKNDMALLPVFIKTYGSLIDSSIKNKQGKRALDLARDLKRRTMENYLQNCC
jgi:ankyrin repeat protein